MEDKEPCVTSIRYSSSPIRSKPKAGDRKLIKGIDHVRVQARAYDGQGRVIGYEVLRGGPDYVWMPVIEAVAKGFFREGSKPVPGKSFQIGDFWYSPWGVLCQVVETYQSPDRVILRREGGLGGPRKTRGLRSDQVQDWILATGSSGGQCVQA